MQRLEPEAACVESQRRPDDALQQDVGIDAEGGGELDQGAGTGDTLAALKLTNRSAMKRGQVAEHFLAYASSAATVGDVDAEALGESQPLW